MNRLFGALAALTALAIIGCGGGGTAGGASNNGGNGGGGNVPLTVFATDDMNAGYDQVWVSIHQVSLQSDAGPVIVFDDPAGKIVDLKTLRSGGGASGARFAFLSDVAVPNRAYKRATVTISKDMKVVLAGQTTAGSRRVASKFDDSSNADRSVLTLEFETEKHLNASRNQMVIDFDLARWIDDGTTITPFLDDASDNQGTDDPNRQEIDDFKGNVAGLTGSSPNFEFDLSVRSGFTMHVRTDSTTKIYNSNASPSPVLNNGSLVEVRGMFNTQSKVFEASSVKIEDRSGNGGDDDGVHGAPSNVDASTGTFEVTIRSADGFLPAGTKVNVATQDSTRFLSHGGVSLSKADFFLSVASATEVEVEGSYDASSNTIFATKAKIEDGDDGIGQSEVRGKTTNRDGAAGSLTLQIEEYEGFIPPSKSIVVKSTPGSRFRDANGKEVSQSSFFALINDSTVVKAEGRFDGTALIASKLEVRKGKGGGGSDD